MEMDNIGLPACEDGGTDLDPLMLSTFDGLGGYMELGTAPSAFSFSVNSEEQTDASISEVGDYSAILASGELMNMSTATVPKPVQGFTLQERLLKALAMLKETSNGGAFLAQVWMPVIRNGDHQVLTTSEQPFLVDQRLTGYREVSRQFTFPAAEGPGLFPGLPGRVFISGMLEWASNVMYYNSSEYLRIDYAMRHEVRGSLALPIFDSSGGGSCCAVLELVMTQEKDNFCSEIDDISNALQSVHLSSVETRTQSQSLTRDQESVFTEIMDVQRAVCHAHMLPLALAWVPVCSISNPNVSVEYCDSAVKFGSRKNDLICIQESACYVNDISMHDFVRACAERPIQRGQGVAGNAIISNIPFFFHDVRDYDIHEYPLVHHARKFGFHAAVAIRLRSTFTGNDDYVLEYFLPLMCRGGEEQQLLLDKISLTMQRVSKSLRTVSDAELMADATTKPSKDMGSEIRCSSSDASVNSSVPSEIKTNIPSGNKMGSTTEELGDKKQANKLKPSTSPREKRRGSTKMNVSLTVLQKYFAGSLKGAAKSIGVCPTTLKRICRQHGILRWPSRKIKKVNRSLKKIQKVISSVHGVNEELKYDPATGFLISSASSSEKPSLLNAEHEGADLASIESEFCELKFKTDCDAYQRGSQGQHVPEVQKGKLGVADFNLNDGGLFRNSGSAGTSRGALSAGRNNVSSLAKEQTSCHETSSLIAGAQHKGVSRDSLYMTQQSEKDTDIQNINQSLPPSSTMTDCSNDIASSHGTFKKCFKSQPTNGINSTIIVKAMYKDDTVRFRLLPTMKYQHLLEEIAKRLKLSVGSLQLKYRDDEGEWVILASDDDLQECLDVLDSIGLRVLKVQVRDVPCAAGSS
ncbi:hypothetical protein ACP70R_004153 [Stipagrostis hirtigluma subsp. patula]